MQASIFWIWLARIFNFWQWTLLYCVWFYQCNECIPCQSYHKHTPLSTIKWTYWEVFMDCENLFYKAKEEGNNLFKCLMIYHNTPLSGSLQSSMQILKNWCARSDLMQLDSSLVYNLRSWELFIRKNICLNMIYTSGKMLCIKMLQGSSCIQLPLQVCVHGPGVTIQLPGKVLHIHLKPYQHQCKKTGDEHSDNDMWT